MATALETTTPVELRHLARSDRMDSCLWHRKVFLGNDTHLLSPKLDPLDEATRLNDFESEFQRAWRLAPELLAVLSGSLITVIQPKMGAGTQLSIEVGHDRLSHQVRIGSRPCFAAPDGFILGLSTPSSMSISSTDFFIFDAQRPVYPAEAEPLVLWQQSVEELTVDVPNDWESALVAMERLKVPWTLRRDVLPILNKVTVEVISVVVAILAERIACGVKVRWVDVGLLSDYDAGQWSEIVFHVYVNSGSKDANVEWDLVLDMISNAADSSNLSNPRLAEALRNLVDVHFRWITGDAI